MPNVHSGSLFKKIINKMTGEVTNKEPVLIKTAAKVVFRESGKDVETSLNSIETSVSNTESAITELQKVTFRIENGVLIATSNP